MAEEKKKEVKKVNIEYELIALLGGLFIIALIVNQVTNYIISQGWGNYGNIWDYAIGRFFVPVWSVWKVISIFLSGGALVWIIYSYTKLQQVVTEDKKIHGGTIEGSILEETVSVEKEKENERWLRVTQQAFSDNPSDWRLAILEADVMLEDVLRKNDYPGDTIGEMLKSAAGADQFLTLEQAWEAHKIRNNIAHGGNDYQLNERETRRAIAAFEQVFREFEVI